MIATHCEDYVLGSDGIRNVAGGADLLRGYARAVGYGAGWRVGGAKHGKA